MEDKQGAMEDDQGANPFETVQNFANLCGFVQTCANLCKSINQLSVLTDRMEN